MSADVIPFARPRTPHKIGVGHIAGIVDDVTSAPPMLPGLKSDPVIALWSRYLAASAAVESIVERYKGVEYGTDECAEGEEVLAEACHRRHLIEDEIIAAEAVTLRGNMIKFHLMYYLIGDGALDQGRLCLLIAGAIGGVSEMLGEAATVPTLDTVGILGSE